MNHSEPRAIPGCRYLFAAKPGGDARQWRLYVRNMTQDGEPETGELDMHQYTGPAFATMREALDYGAEQHAEPYGACGQCDRPQNSNSGTQDEPPATVKRASLWDGVVDTYQTERELNGWRESQGALQL